MLEGNHLVSLLLIVLIGAVSVAAPLVVDRWHDGSIQRWLTTRFDDHGSRRGHEPSGEQALL